VHSHARMQVFHKFVGIPVFLLFLLHTATYTLILIAVVVCYFLLFLFSCYFLYTKILHTCCCLFLLFVTCCYFCFPIISSMYTLHTHWILPSLSLQNKSGMLHDREKITEVVEKKMTVKCST